MSHKSAFRLSSRVVWFGLACAIAAAVPVRAQDAQAPESIAAASGDQPGIGQTTTSANSSASAKLASFAGTVYHYFQETDLHPTLASVAPGGGLTGGIGYDPHRGNPRQLQNSLRASVSTKGYWLALADTTYRVSNIYSLELYGRARHMTELPFYGIGQDSQLSNQTDFTLTERVVGGSAYVRPTPAFAVGGRIEGLWPMVRSGRSSPLSSWHWSSCTSLSGWCQAEVPSGICGVQTGRRSPGPMWAVCCWPRLSSP